MAQTDTCASPNCSCPVTGGDKYCSPYCEAAKDSPEAFCECGHAGCATEIRSGVERVA